MENSVISYFCKSPDWKLLFWDDKSFLWVRNIPKFKELIDKYSYDYFTPYNYIFQKQALDKGIAENISKVKAEVYRKKTEDPNGIILGSFLNSTGNKIK